MEKDQLSDLLNYSNVLNESGPSQLAEAKGGARNSE